MCLGVFGYAKLRSSWVFDNVWLKTSRLGVSSSRETNKLTKYQVKQHFSFWTKYHISYKNHFNDDVIFVFSLYFCITFPCIMDLSFWSWNSIILKIDFIIIMFLAACAMMWLTWDFGKIPRPWQMIMLEILLLGKNQKWKWFINPQ